MNVGIIGLLAGVALIAASFFGKAKAEEEEEEEEAGAPGTPGTPVTPSTPSTPPWSPPAPPAQKVHIALVIQGEPGVDVWSEAV